MIYNDLIRSQFCTCHDSLAVMTCANLWPDSIITIIIITKWSLSRFQLRTNKPSWNGSLTSLSVGIYMEPRQHMLIECEYMPSLNFWPVIWIAFGIQMMWSISRKEITHTWHILIILCYCNDTMGECFFLCKNLDSLWIVRVTVNKIWNCTIFKTFKYPN